MQTLSLIAPARWAFYLIDGDDSSLDANELDAIQCWLMEQKLDFPISSEDAGFRRFHDAGIYAGACDCQKYVFLITEESLSADPFRSELLDDEIPW